MRVRVVYLGMLKEAAGRPQDDFDLPDQATLATLVDACEQRVPAIADFRKILAYSINYEYARLDQPLNNGDEVALLPPVSGGARRCQIVRDAIDPVAILAGFKHPQDGAISIFDGIVRNNTRGRNTLYLVYEAYEEMALRQMEKLCDDALARYAIRDARIVHRLGRLGIGETSVYIAVASAHRAAAMDACRFLIDALKQQVPIWKKEYFADGAVWADGEPFPDAIRGGISVTG
jgi:molybdopterin converting factor subunit 1